MDIQLVSKKQNVLLVLEATLGGTGRHILDLARGLLRRGDAVHLLYSTVRADPQFRSGLAELQRECPDFRACEIPMSRAVTPRDFRTLFQMFRYLKENGPFDLIHGHSTKAGFLARLVPGAGAAARIYTPHSFMTMDPQLRGLARKAVSLLETFLAKRSAKVIVLSREEWNCAHAMGIAAEKLVIIENGVDADALARLSLNRRKMRGSLGLPEDAHCVGFVGRLSDKKEPLRLLDAFAILRERAAHVTKLVIVGSGELESAMRARAKDLGIDSAIVWAGPVDGAAHMCAFDVLALCSRTEAFGYVLLEAMASGLPFVSTATGVAGEFVERGGCGLICDPWDAERFAALLLRVLEEPGLRQALSEGALRIAPGFSVRSMVDRISDLYSVAISGATTAPKPPARSATEAAL